MMMVMMVVMMILMILMIKFDPHEGNSILAGLQMFARNADWHQRLPGNDAEEDDGSGEEREDDGADLHDEEDVDSAAGVVAADVSQNDDNADEDETKL